uniref:Uncharacterized protein n=1 Tax=Triticum urartu TaxID=4572 RepID=A0A8R7P8N9_TRIUA
MHDTRALWLWSSFMYLNLVFASFFIFCISIRVIVIRQDMVVDNPRTVSFNKTSEDFFFPTATCHQQTGRAAHAILGVLYAYEATWATATSNRSLIGLQMDSPSEVSHVYTAAQTCSSLLQETTYVQLTVSKLVLRRCDCNGEGCR